MASVNKKQLIAIIAIVLVTNGATAAIIMSSNDSSKSTATIKKLDKEVSPTALLKQPSQYGDEVIHVKGFIIHSATGYFVVGEEKKAPGALMLDFSKTKIDPKAYVFGPDIPTTPPADKTKVTAKGPYTVTGKLAPSAPGKPLLFVVESIK